MRKDIDDEGADDKAQAAGVSTAATAEGEKAQKSAPPSADDA